MCLCVRVCVCVYVLYFLGDFAPKTHSSTSHCVFVLADPLQFYDVNKVRQVSALALYLNSAATPTRKCHSIIIHDSLC